MIRASQAFGGSVFLPLVHHRVTYDAKPKQPAKLVGACPEVFR